MRIAINGFGRIGKSFLRTIMLDPSAIKKLDVSVINIGPACMENAGLLFKHDTIMGAYPGIVEQEGSTLIIDGKKITLISTLSPLEANWKHYGIDWVVDCSGKYTQREKAEEHLKAGAKAVLISAPAKGDVVTIVPGVNEHIFQKDKDKIVSLGSCTTNAFMTMLKVLHDECGIEQGYMTTVHAYTNSQALLDVDGKDPRRSRAAALNIIPTTTGASKLVGKIIPALEGKIEASALRVPVGCVSFLNFTFTSSMHLSAESINNCFLQASLTTLKGILALSTEPLVSSDYLGSNYSVTIDGLSTQSMGSMAQVSGWYDNEWGYSMRMKDFLLFVEGENSYE